MVIDLHNGVRGILFQHENAGEVIDFVSDNCKGNPMNVIQYVPKFNTYIFGKANHILLDGMYVVYNEKTNHFFLCNSDKWIMDYNV